MRKQDVKISEEMGLRQGGYNTKTLKLESACFDSKVLRPVPLELSDPGG